MIKNIYDLVVVGGGASGFFASIQLSHLYKKNFPYDIKKKQALPRIIILEKTGKALQKVRISGGGRCNLSNGIEGIENLLYGYPRGARELKSGFLTFSNQDTMDWFEQAGIELKIENDLRIFPKSNSSKSIIDLFMNEIEIFHIELSYHSQVIEIIKKKDNDTLRDIFEIQILKKNTSNENLAFSFENATVNSNSKQMFEKNENHFSSHTLSIQAKNVLICTGGNSKISHYNFIERLGHTIITPTPSLFSFNISDPLLLPLMGLGVKEAQVKILETKYHSEGALLITHWGLSGPAILKLSSFASKFLYEKNYMFIIEVNWLAQFSIQEIQDILMYAKKEHAPKKINIFVPFRNKNTNESEIPLRLWAYLLEKSDIELSKKWNDLSSKDIKNILHILNKSTYSIKGKTTYKEEFVTSGGVDLKEVNCKTMESKLHPNLYFAGEVLDIDGITGGYNFQSAWTTATLASQNIYKNNPL